MVDTCADNSPSGSIVDHLFIDLCRARGGLELNDAILRETQVHPLCILHVECNLD